MKKCLNDLSLSDPGLFDDPWLLPFAGIITRRRNKSLQLENRIFEGKLTAGSLSRFADYHLTFGMHREKGQWVFREWAPNATRMFILCEKSAWQTGSAFEVRKKDGEVFEQFFPLTAFSHGDIYRLYVEWPGGGGDRIPTAATRVVQDWETGIFNAQVWDPASAYVWKTPEFKSEGPLLIYETHVGMALEEGRVGTYAEFERYILPKIVDAGYTALQVMAIPEHPYYGSFGYHVSSFFAASSRFGTPEELKSLVDAAHGCGLAVFMDIIHSHAVNNEVEGISRFDGTLYQFFHDGPKGHHRLWDSRCFDYAKPIVIKFLLSNLRYWIETFHIDGFRFDGITSMLFEDHGLGRAFTSYKDYYGSDVDEDALSYLYLANQVVHTLNPCAVTIAEDVSGYPGLAAPAGKGGTGFDCRYAMGVADYWIKLLKEFKDDDWPMRTLWYELTSRRKEEKTISYAESHDQALVGDKTLMMHLMGDRIYDGMNKSNTDIHTLRAVALHKMIRLITLGCSGSGYLNFMGNEFGHPEWVDFPSPANQFSYHYARRQWSLRYDPACYYACLFAFDKDMISLARTSPDFFRSAPELLHIHEDNKLIALQRGRLVFVFNFHPNQSYSDYLIGAPPGRYEPLLDTDQPKYGGLNRLDSNIVHFTRPVSGSFEQGHQLSLYVPCRSAMVLIRQS